jgi:hypothetical protein
MPMESDCAAARPLDAEASAGARAELQRKAGYCAGALQEARRLAATGRFGAACSRLLARADDVLDEIDEILVGLYPRRDHESFLQAAQLHRELETIQSRTPREFRWIVRRHAACATQPAETLPPTAPIDAQRSY